MIGGSGWISRHRKSRQHSEAEIRTRRVQPGRYEHVVVVRKIRFPKNMMTQQVADFGLPAFQQACCKISGLSDHRCRHTRYCFGTLRSPAAAEKIVISCRLLTAAPTSWKLTTICNTVMFTATPISQVSLYHALY